MDIDLTLEERSYFPRPFQVGHNKPFETQRKPMEFGVSYLPKNVPPGSRYDSTSPPPGEAVKSTPADEKAYHRIQPKQIEYYEPGLSSLASYESEV